uniref:Uncharacterized protein n=1 Tax=Panulirus argus virus 1 TaxID=380624 RepID=A0A6G9HDM7_9VIRU|nr:hypothetical protein [Panulirus argus virus 1]
MCNGRANNGALPEEEVINLAKSLISGRSGNTKCISCNGTLICSEEGKIDYILNMCNAFRNDPNFALSNDDEDAKMAAKYNTVLSRVLNGA